MTRKTRSTGNSWISNVRLEIIAAGILTHVYFVLHTVINYLEQSHNVRVATFFHNGDLLAYFVLGSGYSIGDWGMWGSLNRTSA